MEENNELKTKIDLINALLEEDFDVTVLGAVDKDMNIFVRHFAKEDATDVPVLIGFVARAFSNKMLELDPGIDKNELVEVLTETFKTAMLDEADNAEPMPLVETTEED